MQLDKPGGWNLTLLGIAVGTVENDSALRACPMIGRVRFPPALLFQRLEAAPFSNANRSGSSPNSAL